MKRNILVGSHHKTGTTWLCGIFSSFCDALNIPFHNVSGYCTDFSDIAEKNEFIIRKSREDCGVFFDANSSFPRIADKEKCNFIGIRIIRDPRDIIISAAYYHQHAKEKWLHKRQDGFAGMTYQEKLNSLGTLDQKLMFEMKHTSARVIKRMNTFNSQGLFHTYKYEILIEDSDMIEWKRMAGLLDLEDHERDVFLKSIYKNSLFGGKKKAKPGSQIRNGKAMQYLDAQYADFFPQFETLFPGVLRNLGYA